MQNEALDKQYVASANNATVNNLREEELEERHEQEVGKNSN